MADGFTVDAERDNMKLNGFFFCKGSNCTNIKKPFSCDRYCSKITTSLMNTFVMHNNSVTTLDCEAAYALTEANGSSPGLRLEKPVKIWDESVGYLLTHCIDIQRVSQEGNFMAYDCLNGTVLDSFTVPEPFTNFTTFWKIYENSTTVLDPTQRYLPKQSTLTIYNTTKLFINLEGCVNTLRGECKEFLFTHGQDGAKNTAQSRFQCYYNKEHSDFVVARFDLNRTWRELLIAVIVPSSLFLISMTALCIISQTVQVGDDAKMRCQYCLTPESEEDAGNVVTSQPGKSSSSRSNSKGKGGRGKPNGEDVDGGRHAEERMNGLRAVDAKCDERKRATQEISDDTGRRQGAEDHLLIPLSPCGVDEQQPQPQPQSEGEEEDAVAESCLTSIPNESKEAEEVSTNPKKELKEAVEKEEEEEENPDQNLMIL